MKVMVYEREGMKHVDAVNNAIDQLKKMIKKEGLFEELKRRESYMSPSKKKKFRKTEAERRRKRDERKHQWYMKKNKD